MYSIEHKNVFIALVSVFTTIIRPELYKTKKGWLHIVIYSYIYIYIYTGCPRRNGHNFGRVFLMLKYTDITQNTYIQS